LAVPREDFDRGALRAVANAVLRVSAFALLASAFAWPFVGDFSGPIRFAFLRYIGGVFGLLGAAIAVDTGRRRWVA